jgi:hypothetical protein
MKIRISPRSGFTYMTVVITMIVVGLTLAAYMKLVTVQNQLTMRSQTWNRSVPVIEAGVEEAMAHLNRNGSPINGYFDAAKLATDGWTGNTTDGWLRSGQVGNDYYFVHISPWSGLSTSFPKIYSTSIVEQLPAYALQSHGGFFVADTIQEILQKGSFSKRIVQCATTNIPIFTKALVAKKGIDMAGQNVRTDSFDSGDTNYHDGFGHYTNTPGRWKCNGDIASNDTITNAVCIGNANIYGRVATGPYGTVCVGTLGMVGDIAWQDDPANKGKIKPGWSTDDMNIEFPSVTVPTNSWISVTRAPFTDTNGVVWDYYLTGSSSPSNYTCYMIIPGGEFKGNIYISGYVRLLVSYPSKISLSGDDKIKIAPGGYLELYADVATASLGGKGVQNDGIATQFYYFGTDRNTSLSYGGNAAFTGVFYAPNAALTLGGGGSTQIDFSGSAIARTVKLNGNFTFHYDENLKRVGLYRGFVITSWNEK